MNHLEEPSMQGIQGKKVVPQVTKKGKGTRTPFPLEMEHEETSMPLNDQLLRSSHDTGDDNNDRSRNDGQVARDMAQLHMPAALKCLTHR